uniref:GPI mannosyltransferase 2 n=1 Tax=Angiostrongylus cantonensis TaxID=6313 RepID=A0A0K0D0Y9_ANGCA
MSLEFVLFRFFVFVLQLLFNSWDFSTDAFKGVPVDEEELSRLDYFIQRIFSGFKRWDAVHMLHIAQHEYVFENSLAFFPFYPMTVRYLLMLLEGCFVTCAAVLYRIVLHISKSVKQSVIAVLLFSANPASIFFSAAYSLSLTILSFKSIMSCTEIFKKLRCSGGPWYHLSELLFFFFYRSNGLLNLAYVWFFCALEYVLSVDPENPRRRLVIFKSGLSAIISQVGGFFAFYFVQSIGVSIQMESTIKKYTTSQ